MCTHMCMGTKNISIMNDVYELLLRRKMKNESFSDVIRKEFTKKRSIMEFAGAWKDLVSDEEAENMKKNIAKFRKNALKGTLRRIKTR